MSLCISVCVCNHLKEHVVLQCLYVVTVNVRNATKMKFLGRDREFCMCWWAKTQTENACNNYLFIKK